jgi:hypothetical protein
VEYIFSRLGIGAQFEEAAYWITFFGSCIVEDILRGLDSEVYFDGAG